jgi:NAD(P)-dependent dehydrogenase (short-subunit alcohol dehydrogenase family)
MCSDSNPDHWRAVIAVDLQGPYYRTQQAPKRMLPKQRGVIL